MYSNSGSSTEPLATAATAEDASVGQPGTALADTERLVIILTEFLAYFEMQLCTFMIA
jgi:hypothetical protein